MRPELFRYLIFKAEELLKLSCQVVQSGFFGFGRILLLSEQKALVVKCFDLCVQRDQLSMCRH